MANSDAPRGLQPFKHLNGAPYNGSVQPYYIPASYGTALFIGDPVVKTGTSNTAEYSAASVGTFPAGTLPEVNKATAGDGNALTGVIVGFEPLPDGLDLVYNPASTARVALVCDDPDVSFEIQADGTVAATDIGANANLIFTNAGNANTGLSGAELDTSAMAAVATNQLTIQRVINRTDNELGEFVKLEVKINNHTEVAGVAGI